MAAIIIAIGLIVLHSFATAVLWFELRSYEKESRQRIQKFTDMVLDAIGLLRGDLAHQGLLRPPPGGTPPPAPPPAAQFSAPPSTAREPRKASTHPPVDTATMTEEERARGLTVAMVTPARRVVSVTRDDDPIHTRETVEIPKASAEGDSDQESAEELRRVMLASERPTVEGMPPPPEPEAKHRTAGVYSIVNLEGTLAKPGEDIAPITPTKPSHRGE